MTARTSAAPTVELFGLPIADLSMRQTVELIDRRIRNREPTLHTAVNAGKLVAMRRDRELFDSVRDADLINADGQAVVWASRLLGRPLPERVAGIDLMLELLSLAARQGYRVFLLGATAAVVERVAEIVGESHGAEVVAGYRDGYFDDTDGADLARRIAGSGADMLFVAMSSPRKEKFLCRHREALRPVPFIMGVGGSFDVVAGRVQRAPRWMQRAGLEWLFRFVQEPRRMWRRYLVGNLRFCLLVAGEAARRRRR